MTVFLCEDSFEGVFSVIYDAWASKISHKELRIHVGTVQQRELFTEYIFCDSDSEKAEKVMRTIVRKISYKAYRQCMYCALSSEEDRADVIYRFLLLGFTVGAAITDYLKEPSVMRLFEYGRKVSNEAHYYREFLRFSKEGEIYISHISPPCDVLEYVGDHFSDRMPSESFLIIDDNRKKALIHPEDQDYYVRILTEQEFAGLKQHELKKDEYSSLWKTFFDTIAIKERTNPACQRNHLPLFFRKHMTEFQ